MQISYVNGLIKLADEKKLNDTARSVAMATLSKIRKWMGRNTKGDGMSKAHRARISLIIDRAGAVILTAFSQ